MKRLIYLILILPMLLFSYKLELNKNDIAYIKQSKKKSFIITRLKRYQNIKKKVKNYSTIRKLSHINSFLNKILPKHDIKANLQTDYWSTPKEFLIKGHGDCEDYVIAKYFTLLELGVKKKNMYFAVVDVKGYKNSSHMVLFYLDNKKAVPLVLDNLSTKVVPLSKRVKLVPRFAFNEIDSYRFNKKGLTTRTNINWGGDNKMEKLLKRVYTLNE